MKSVFVLAAGFLREHPVRVVLTVFATLSATCLVLWMVGGYEALLRTYDDFAERALGRYELAVDPISRAFDREVMPEVVDALLEDPAVTAAEPMWAGGVTVRTRAVRLVQPPPGSGSEAAEPMGEALLLGTDAGEPPFDLTDGVWISGVEADDGRIPVAVNEQIAELYGLRTGSTLVVGRDGAEHELLVAGVVDNPPVPMTGRSSVSLEIPGPGVAGIYATMEGAERVFKQERKITFVGICLEEGTDVHGFRYRWAPKLAGFERPAQFQEDHDLEEQLDEAAAARNMKLQAYAGTVMALLLAFLVIFNTLNMGVAERTRQFAMLRAICLTKWQTGAIIFVESLIIATAGFAGGVPGGQLLLSAAGRTAGRFLRDGAGVGGLGLGLAALATFGAALLAALVPAWRATRVRPLDAMNPPRSKVEGGGAWVWLLALAGLALIAVGPVLTFVFEPGTEAEAKRGLLLAILSLGAGFLLVAPATVVLTDRFAGPVLARLLGLSPELLAQQLSCHLGRTVASAMALGIGLTLFISIQVWGYTLLEAFVPGRWAPQVLLNFEPMGLTRSGVEGVKALPGVDGARCAPIFIEQPRLKQDLTGSAERASVTRQDNVVVVGIDPETALGGDAPLLDFQYLRGTRDEALELMKTGRGCVVPEHFLGETGLDVGDSFEVVPPENPRQAVSYTIAASVGMQGWHWITKLGGMRLRTHRAAALVIADYQNVRDDFDLFKPRHVWLRSNGGAGSKDAVHEEARRFYQEALGRDVAGGKPPKERESLPYVQALSDDDVRQTIRGNANRWLWAASVMPLVAVLIGGVGVLTVIISSVRSRRWEMGVLRAVGYPGGTLVRLVVAEGLLVGVVACVLSLGFGIAAGWCGTGMSQYLSFFGGLKPELVIPFGALATGVVVVLVFAALAAAGPAWRAGRARPLELLQGGRISQ